MKGVRVSSPTLDGSLIIDSEPRQTASVSETDRFFVDPRSNHPLAAGVRWLSVESTLRWLDPLILVAKPPRVQDLGAALGDSAALALLAREIIRFNGRHLQLLEMREVHRHGRRHHVALALGLDDEQLALVDEMNLAALCVVPDPADAPVRWLSRWQPVWIGQRQSCVPATSPA
jgi:hypothetical protein